MLHSSLWFPLSKHPEAQADSSFKMTDPAMASVGSLVPDQSSAAPTVPYLADIPGQQFVR